MRNDRRLNIFSIRLTKVCVWCMKLFLSTPFNYFTTDPKIVHHCKYKNTELRTHSALVSQVVYIMKMQDRLAHWIAQELAYCGHQTINKMKHCAWISTLVNYTINQAAWLLHGWMNHDHAQWKTAFPLNCTSSPNPFSELVPTEPFPQKHISKNLLWTDTSNICNFKRLAANPFILTFMTTWQGRRQSKGEVM